MSDIAIKFENISKQYRLGNIGTGTLSHDLNRWWAMNIRGKEDPYLQIGSVNQRESKADSDYVWALRDIDFEVKKGEVLGIIGKNGAGKSTLLKLLSRVTSPTTGRIVAEGRIASLLEVGTGFHPEMTGRENIFMNGAIMGMTKADIRRRFDEIVDFSGVERYIDTPVKRYSSGMTVRLGFAIAAHLEPEILVVDEVLAVGDAEFQKKAIGKMQDVSHSSGRTVLFVSHNMVAINRLCSYCILINEGKVGFQGGTKAVVDFYLNANETLQELYMIEPGWFNLSEHINKKRKNEGILGVEIFCNDFKTNLILVGEKVEFKFTYKTLTQYKEPVLGIVIKDKDEMPILGLNNRNTRDSLADKKQEDYILVKFPTFRLIKAGRYFVDIYFGDEENNVDTIIDAFYFNVIATIDDRKPIQERLNFFYDSEIKFY